MTYEKDKLYNYREFNVLIVCFSINSPLFKVLRKGKVDL
jgi:hypothetical protein